MKYNKKDNSYTIAKKLKISPNNKRAEIFTLLFGNQQLVNKSAAIKAITPKETLKRFIAERPSKQLLTGGRKFLRKQKREEALKLLREKYPPELLAPLNKKQRRKYRKEMSDSEWYVFCVYAKSCRRGKREHVKRARSKNNKTGQSSTRLAYNNFINSPMWTDIKNRYWQNHARKCAACGTSKFIHLHHMVYGEFGQEQDEHMIPLCREHHDEYHAKNGTQRNMILKTMAFVDSKLAQQL